MWLCFLYVKLVHGTCIRVCIHSCTIPIKDLCWMTCGFFYAHMVMGNLFICLFIISSLLIKTSLFTFNLLNYFILYCFRVEEHFMMLCYIHVIEFGLFFRHLSLEGSINKRPWVLPILPGYLVSFKSRFFQCYLYCIRNFKLKLKLK